MQRGESTQEYDLVAQMWVCEWVNNGLHQIRSEFYS